MVETRYQEIRKKYIEVYPHLEQIKSRNSWICSGTVMQPKPIPSPERCRGQ